jgi:fibronectin type 3 domain-containing protein
MKKITVKQMGFLKVPAMFILLFFAGCADIFQDKIPVNPEDTNPDGSLAVLLNPPQEEVIAELPPPAQLFVDDGGSPTGIRLSWTAVGGASSYVVERAVIEPLTDGDGAISYPLPEEEHFDVLDPFVYAPAYTDKIIDNPRQDSPEYLRRYYYRVRAENVGAKLEPSGPSESRMGTLFGPPRNVKAGLGISTTEIALVWSPVNRAAAYTVYRSDYESGASPYRIDRVSGSRYRNIISEDEQGREYYYTVTAENSSGAVSVSSSLAMGFALMAGAPEAPENVRLAPGSGRGNHLDQIAIEWDAVPEASYYAVYRYSSADSALTRLTDKTTQTAWTDAKQLKTGVYYYYQVQAIAEEEGKVLKKSGFSTNEVEGFILSPPATAEALKSEGGIISVNWKSALGRAAEQAGYSYEIYGDNSRNGDFASLAVFVAAPATVHSDGYIHADNVPAYSFYRIVTVNGSIKSQPGEIFAPPPKAALILDASKRANLSGQSPNSSGIYPVRITWKKPDGDTPSAYRVYRSLSPDTGFQAIPTTSPILIPASAESGGEFSYVDNNITAKPGIFYYYRVLSLNILGQGKYYSETKQGYGALTHDQFFREYVKTVNSSLGKLINMNKPGSTDKLGDETKTGTISGTIAYDTPDSVLSAVPPFNIYITYTDYADFYINKDSSLGAYFVLNGQSNTKVTNMSGNGSMFGTVTASGMYPGTVSYGNIIITGQVANGGTYTVHPDNFPEAEVSWTLGQR